MRLLRLALLLALPLAVPSMSPAQAPVRDAWIESLAHSVNIGRWWRHVPWDTTAHLDRHVGSAAIQDWAAHGIRAVRILVHPEMLLDQAVSGRLRADRIKHLRRHVDLLASQGISAVLALHLEPAERLEDPAWHARYHQIWAGLSLAMRDVPVGRLAYEIASEPTFVGKERLWGERQSNLAMALRRGEPSRILILNPARWSSLWALEDLPVLTDDRTIVAVHYYDPAVVTHQGASWGGPRVESALANVPFPPTAASCRAVVAVSEAGRRVMDSYCATDPEAEMDSHFARIERWRVRTGVPVWLSEFGVIESAPASTREAWLVAVVQRAAKAKVPWSLFAVDEGFGLLPTGGASPAWGLWAMLVARR